MADLYFNRLKLIKLGLAPKESGPKPRKPIKPISDKKAAEMKAVKNNNIESDLDKWFSEIEDRHFSSGFGICMETGDSIPRAYARAATAHLLPKKIFKSVATHPLNYLILSAANGSHDKTHRIDKFIKMKIWPQAKERILQMIPLLPTDELRRISNQLLVALDMTDK